VHFGDRHFQLFPSCEYAFAPGKSPVEVQPEIFDIFLSRKVFVDYMECQAGFSSCGECEMNWPGFISFYSPFL
jgi:hypothetical protein